LIGGAPCVPGHVAGLNGMTWEGGWGGRPLARRRLGPCESQRLLELRRGQRGCGSKWLAASDGRGNTQ